MRPRLGRRSGALRGRAWAVHGAPRARPHSARVRTSHGVPALPGTMHAHVIRSWEPGGWGHARHARAPAPACGRMAGQGRVARRARARPPSASVTGLATKPTGWSFRQLLRSSASLARRGWERQQGERSVGVRSEAPPTAARRRRGARGSRQCATHLLFAKLLAMLPTWRRGLRGPGAARPRSQCSKLYAGRGALQGGGVGCHDAENARGATPASCKAVTLLLLVACAPRVLCAPTAADWRPPPNAPQPAHCRRAPAPPSTKSQAWRVTAAARE